ncbi:hypothetical protein CARUB_v10015397mg [Capsella rubella]|uniref:Glabrous enhancer-binding protein-like DBD domain-containing protein n=1 Tax=Capsella rubella TaxID=81985 RepID=R0G9D6_9BRAS|nr:hypothetical protein CARUB_v10015397mg [Capsella rubella]
MAWESSSDEEEDSGFEEEEGGASTAKKTSVPESAPRESSNDEDEESASDKEEEEDSAPVVATGFAYAHVSASLVAATASSDSKETESRSAPAPASSHKKRQITEVAAALTVAKRAKNVRFQRVWSEKDEIMLLQGLIEYQSKTGQSDSEDMNAFFHSIQRSISFEMKSVRQMTSKIWFLRKKYKNEKGQKRCFTEEHDLTCFELVKKIWGSEVIDSTIAEVDFTVPSD